MSDGNDGNDRNEGKAPDRRAFLLGLARTAAYSAPAIYTLAAPKSVQGQGLSGKGMMMMMPMGMPDVATPFQRSLPSAPWGQKAGGGPD